jgi:transcriptional regulator with XRE-family HTH domain
MSREKLLKKPAYWFEYEQNELFRLFTAYMEKENINKTQLAERLGVTKGYISQILNGHFNYTLKKLIEISLAIGIVPHIKYTSVEDVIKEDAQTKYFLDNYVFDSQNNVFEMNTEKNDSFLHRSGFSVIIGDKNLEPTDSQKHVLA